MTRIKIRRGKQEDLNSITLAEGEIGYTTDTKEIYIGDGSDNLRVGGFGEIFTVGDIKHSMLTEAQFQLLNGTKWVLADGQSVSESEYHNLTGQSNVPDLRGQFLRGKDHGAGNNPDGNQPLGTSQSDATAINGLSASDSGHTHTVTDSGHSHGDNFSVANGGAHNHRHDGTADGGPLGNGSSSSSYQVPWKYHGGDPMDIDSTNSDHSHTLNGSVSSNTANISASTDSANISLSSTDSETRPKNVTVNFFIKIN